MGDAGELNVFIAITIFCVIVGGVVMVFLKPLKALTHGAEDLDSDAPSGH